MAGTIIEPELLERFKENSKCNALVEMAATNSHLTAQLGAQTYPTREARLNAVSSTLRNFAEESQKGVLEFLKKEQKEKPTMTFEGLWITNQIILRNADLDLVEKLAKIEGIGAIRAERHVQLHQAANVTN